MQQTSLFEVYPNHPGYRKIDTSKQAAEAIAPATATLRQMCVKALQSKPMTADECAESLGLSILAIRPRFTELRKMELIADTGERRENISGRNAAVWRLR